DAVIRRGSFVLGPVSLEITWQERIAIVGPNGSGKTTLLHALLGTIPLESGRRYFGPGVVVGEMDQSRGQYAGDQRALDAFDATLLLVTHDRRFLDSVHVTRTIEL